ncbi:MAG: hybrid sensor histidine kinase/response regulator [Hyphomonadaceae bacterium]
MADEAAPFPRSRFPRAEWILAAAIGIVSILVVAFVFALRAEDPAHARTLSTIALARTVRDETLALTQAMAIAESARSTRRPELREQGRQEARVHVDALATSARGDAELEGHVAAISNIVDADFSRADPDTHSRLRTAVGDLITAANERNDVARNAENRLRARLDQISIILAALSLAASALAILSLRRERQQWRLANQLAETARAKAAASDLAKTRFLATASHDMRQPLHALTLYISALERRVETPEARDILAKMERATNSMVGMFATLLDLARIQAGVVSPETRPFALQEVLDRIIAENPGGSIDIVHTDATLDSDPVLIERILRNLVSNALKHGGGHARIEVDRTRSGSIDIAVVDEGPGIAPADQERIFDEFVRLDERAHAEGLGLGLAIVKRIADLLGAEISLSSPAGGGARFTLRIAAANGAAAPSAADQAQTQSLSERVLVVDDDALARGAMAGALRDLGAEVRDAANAGEAEAVLHAGFRPRLIVMDLRIDGELSGVTLAQRLIATAPARVIIVTGDTAPDTLALLRASGFQWLIKPVDPARLSEAAFAAAK